MRVYHDNSIEKETKCELECIKNDSGEFIDNVDFCNVENMPPNDNAPEKFLLKDIETSIQNSHPWNAAFIHGMVSYQRQSYTGF